MSKKEAIRKTFVFSNQDDYEMLEHFLNENEGTQAELVIEAIKEFQFKKEAGYAVSSAPASLQDMFAGDKDKLLIALDTIKQTYLTLMTSTASKIDERETQLRNLYDAKIQLLTNELEQSKGKLSEVSEMLVVAQNERDEAIKNEEVATEKKEQLDKQIVAKDELLASEKERLEELKEEKSRLLELNVQKDNEITELKAFERQNQSLKAQVDELSLANRLNEQEIANQLKEISRLTKVEETYVALQTENQQLNKQLVQSESAITQLEDQKARYANELHDAKEQLLKEEESSSKKIESLEEKNQLLQQKIDELYNQLLDRSKKTE